MKPLLIAVLLGFAGFAHANSACDKPRDDFDGLYCLNKVWQEADKELNEAYKALTPKLDANGKLIKDKLLKTFVMAKGAGWGDSVKAPSLRNGDWVYSAWESNGVGGLTTAPDLTASCRGCHMAFADKDFMPRYDEYYNKAAK